MLRQPRVSIGLPVFNGSRHLTDALSAILAQTYTDFELIISDNASTDGTAEICRRFAAQDPRIRYYRQPRNIGAAPNFNFCYELATGEYFKWAAHDDILAPEFLARCVEALDATPDAVLCQSLVRLVDEQDRFLGVYRPVEPYGAELRASVRFHQGCARDRRCLTIFGLIRANALRGSVLMGSYISSDRTLLVELALRGRFLHIDDVLFINRDHPGRLSRITLRGTRKDMVVQLDTDRADRPDFSSWTYYRWCVRLIHRHVRAPGERLRCYGYLLVSVWQRRKGGLLLFEPLMALDPRLYRLVKAVRASAVRLLRSAGFAADVGERP